MPLPPVLRSLVRKTPTIAPVPHRAVLSVTGSQAAEFLNGVVASSVPSSPDAHFYTAFLQAQVNDIRVIVLLVLRTLRLMC